MLIRDKGKHNRRQLRSKEKSKTVEEKMEKVPKRKYEVKEDWAKEGDFPDQPEPHPCDRVCKKDDSRKCHFKFVVEHYTSLGKVNIKST